MGISNTNIKIRIIISLFSFLFISSAFSPFFIGVDETSAAEPPDEDQNNGGNGTADFNNTWYIGSGQNMIRANQTLNLTGDLVINNSGRLVLTNFTLHLNNSFDGEFSITVKAGGILEILENSLVAAKNNQYSYGFMVQPNGTLRLNSSTIKNCGWDDADPGLRLNFDPSGQVPSNSSINNATITECYTGLTVINSSTDLIISNSSIYNNTGWGIYSAGAPVVLKNSTFNNSGAEPNGAGRVWQQYFLNLQVNDSVTLQPVSDAIVTVIDANGTTGSVSTTDVNGQTLGLNLTGFRIFNNGTNVSYTPHNVSVKHPDYFTNFAEPEIMMTMNVNSTVLLDLNNSLMGVDQIVIETRPNGTGSWVGSRSYGVGGTDLFSCVGYNYTYGYVGDVNANWTISNDTLANVTPTGNFTLFTVDPKNPGGTVRITAEFEGLSNRTGVLTINKATEDLIVIMDQPNGTGSWVGDRSIPTNTNETFYCAVFNDTIGYLGDVNASWTVFNPYVGSIDPFGVSAVFFGLAEGITPVEASYVSDDLSILTNQTGLIDVKSFKIDSIVIKNGPGDTGNWIGPGDYNTTASLMFYCAGYNKSRGYIQDVPATWQLDGDLVGHFVSRAENGVELIITDSGNAHVVASFNGLSNRSGLLRFSSALPDYEVNGLDITFSPDNNELFDSMPATVQVKIRNRGGSSGSQVLLTVYNSTFEDQDPKHLKTVMLEPFGRFQTRTHNLTWIPEYIGLNTVSVSVDESNYIIESNENNNYADRMINVVPFLPDLVKIIIEPTNVEVEAGSVQQFTATGFFEDNSSRKLSYPAVRWSASGGAKINTTGHFFSLSTGTYNVTAKSGLINNLTTAIVIPAPLELIEVFPNPHEMEEGDTRKFVAYGYDEYYNLIEISPTWSVSGGGTINNDGEFLAGENGTWLVFARVSDVIGNSTVTVKPSSMELVRIMVFPSKVILILGEEFQFIAIGVDKRGDEHILAPFWKTNGGGQLSTSGQFNATEVGRWTITASRGGVVGSAEIIIDTAVGKKHFETFVDPRSGVRLIASFQGWGTFWVNRIASPGPSVLIPENMITVNRFYEITKTAKLILDWVLISVPYSSDDIPEDQKVLESDLKLYFWDIPRLTWFVTDDPDVDIGSKFVFGNVTHLTLFAPMIDISEPDKDEVDGTGYSSGFWTLMIIIIVIVIVILGLLILFMARPDHKERIFGSLGMKEPETVEKKLEPKPVTIIKRKKQVKQKKDDESAISDDEMEEE